MTKRVPEEATGGSESPPPLWVLRAVPQPDRKGPLAGRRGPENRGRGPGDSEPGGSRGRSPHRWRRDAVHGGVRGRPEESQVPAPSCATRFVAEWAAFLRRRGDRGAGPSGVPDSQRAALQRRCARAARASRAASFAAAHCAASTLAEFDSAAYAPGSRNTRRAVLHSVDLMLRARGVDLFLLMVESVPRLGSSLRSGGYHDARRYHTLWPPLRRADDWKAPSTRCMLHSRLVRWRAPRSSSSDPCCPTWGRRSWSTCLSADGHVVPAPGRGRARFAAGRHHSGRGLSGRLCSRTAASGVQDRPTGGGCRAHAWLPLRYCLWLRRSYARVPRMRGRGAGRPHPHRLAGGRWGVPAVPVFRRRAGLKGDGGPCDPAGCAQLGPRPGPAGCGGPVLGAQLESRGCRA